MDPRESNLPSDCLARQVSGTRDHRASIPGRYPAQPRSDFHIQPPAPFSACRGLPVSSEESRTYTRRYKECCRHSAEGRPPSEDAEQPLLLRRTMQDVSKVKCAPARPQEPIPIAAGELRTC